jgi:hypothetical protein
MSKKAQKGALRTLVRHQKYYKGNQMTCRQRFSNVGTSEKEKKRRVDPLGEEEAERKIK